MKPFEFAFTSSILAVTCASVLSLSLPASAQDDAEEAKDHGLEEIVITAQRRETSLQRTNISITSFSGSDLAERGVDKPLDLTEYVPNVNLQLNATGNGFFAASRGIAQADASLITRDPGMPMYIDGVYWGMTNGSLIDVLDIERIEVLRGPQGDLYGRNSTGGAINIITRKPSGSWGMKGRISGGYDQFGLISLYQEFPIFSDENAGNLSGSVSFSGKSRVAYYDNALSDDIDEQKRLSTRAAIHYEIASFTFDASVDYSYLKEQGPEMQLTHIDAAAPSGALQTASGTTPAGLTVLGEMNRIVSSTRASRLDITGSQAPSLQNSTGTAFSPPLGLMDDRLENLGVSYALSNDFDHVGPVGDLSVRYTGGYREIWDDSYSDRDGTRFDVFGNYLFTRQWQTSHDFNAVGTTDLGAAGDLDYVVGYFLFAEEGRQDSYSTSLADPLLFGGFATRQFPEIDNIAHALYLHLAYYPPLGQRQLKLELGLRQTWEEKEITSEQWNLNPRTRSFPKTSASESFDQFTPSGRVSYQWPEDLIPYVSSLNTYASVAQGYLAGGFNGRATYPDAAAARSALGLPPTAPVPSFILLETPYEEETLLSVELGFKSQLWNNRIRLNAAGFWMDYENMQRTQIVLISTTTVSGVFNADSAEVWGCELELLAEPIDDLVVIAGYGLADAEYLDYRNAAGVNLASSREFSNAPKHSVNVGAQYTANAFDKAAVSGRLDYYWQSRTLLQNGDNPNAGQGAYGLLNGRVTLREMRVKGLERVELSVWAKNLLDREYKPFGIDFGQALYVVQYFGQRRTIGVDLTWRFGDSM